MSIATEISRIQQAKADIKSAIEAKGVTVPSSALLDTYDDYVSQISGGGGGNPTAEDNDVILIDYDGTIRYSYSATEFAALTELPANPTHDGLTAQGWNWTLSDAKTYVAAYGALVIGQNYITTDGKTRFGITIPDSYVLTTPFNLNVGSGSVIIDWGDGSATETYSTAGFKQLTHTYPSKGSYVIEVTCSDGGSWSFGVDSSSGVMFGNALNDSRMTRNWLRWVRIGSGVTDFTSHCFRYHGSLETVTVPRGITIVRAYPFEFCASLRAFVAPPGCYRMANGAFRECRSLLYVSFPNSMETFGDSLFNLCSSLHKLTIQLSSSGNILLSAIREDPAIATIILPSGITSIADYGFYGNTAITSITIPSTITSIGALSFGNNNSLKAVVMKPTTPPTITANTFINAPSNIVFYVPSASLTTYQGATNWSTYSSKMIGY